MDIAIFSRICFKSFNGMTEIALSISILEIQGTDHK